jgi:hypothetical protein
MEPADLHRGLGLQNAPLEFDAKLNAILYVNSNCNALSGRHLVMRQLSALLAARNSSLAIHSYGSCDPTMDAAALAAFNSDSKSRIRKKLDYFRRAKFCVVRQAVLLVVAHCMQRLSHLAVSVCGVQQGECMLAACTSGRASRCLKAYPASMHTA